MVGLLVGIALMSISLSVALPVWRTLVQREKEEELLWRGQQYARAILLYQRKTSAPGPPSVDILVEQRFLRRKYKDPITNGDFELIAVGTPNAPGTPGAPGAPGGPNAPGQGGRQDRRSALGSRTSPSERGSRGASRDPRMPQRAEGQLIGGVRSRSTKRSLKVVNGRSVYNEWQFTYEPFQFGARPQGPEDGTGPGGRRPGSRPGVRPGTFGPTRPGSGRSPSPSPR